jgi:hypothetical protein
MALKHTDTEGLLIEWDEFGWAEQPSSMSHRLVVALRREFHLRRALQETVKALHSKDQHVEPKRR